MLQRSVTSLLVISAVGTGVIGGVLFAFTFVMDGLGRLAPSEGIAAMQRIDKAIVSPLFLVVFVGMGITCAALVVATGFRWGEPGAWLQLLGALAYLVTIAITAGYHVPRNEALQLLDPATVEATRYWETYVPGWVAWNHVRTFASVAAATLLTLAARLV